MRQGSGSFCVFFSLKLHLSCFCIWKPTALLSFCFAEERLLWKVFQQQCFGQSRDPLKPSFTNRAYSLLTWSTPGQAGIFCFSPRGVPVGKSFSLAFLPQQGSSRGGSLKCVRQEAVLNFNMFRYYKNIWDSLSSLNLLQKHKWGRLFWVKRGDWALKVSLLLSSCLAHVFFSPFTRKCSENIIQIRKKIQNNAF